MFSLGVPFWNRQTRQRNNTPAQIAPDYIQVVTQRLNHKRHLKEISDMQARQQQEQEDRMKKAKGRSSGRRATAIMMDFFAPPVTGTPSNQLPQTQRARRSSIFTKPSLVRPETKVKLPRRGKQGKKGKQGVPEGGGGEEADMGVDNVTQDRPKGKKKPNPKKVIPATFSDISETPEDTFGEEGKVPSPRPTRNSRKPGGKAKYQVS